MEDPGTLESILLWLESSSAAMALRQSSWLYPIVEIVHITGFAVLVGAAVMFDLRLLGLAKQIPVRAASGHLTLWARLSLIAVIPSGFLLFMVGATTMAYNPAFQIKMLFLLAAGINAAVFHRFTFKSVDSWNQYSPTPVPARLAGILSIVLWIGVISGGRFIAYM